MMQQKWRIPQDHQHNSTTDSAVSAGSFRGYPFRGVLHKIEQIVPSPDGMEQVELIILDEDNELHPAVACSQRFGDLSLLHPFEGLEVQLLWNNGRLELLPLVEQESPAEQIRRDACWPPLRTGKAQKAPQRSPMECGSCRRTESLQQVAETVARLAKEHSLATCMWIHLP